VDKTGDVGHTAVTLAPDQEGRGRNSALHRPSHDRKLTDFFLMATRSDGRRGTI
jgi:hypothetical protein